MLKFNYYVRDPSGKPHKGLVEAVDKSQAAQILKEKGYIIITLNPKTEGLLTVIKRRFFTRVGMNEVVNFTRQMATMINAGLVITDALTVLKAQTPNPSMVAVIDSLQKEIEAGTSFSQALRKHKHLFGSIYIALIRSGETAGILDRILSRLADNLEKQREFIGKIKSAMVYPFIIVVGMIIVATIMMIFVIPKLLDLYQEFEATLPTSTMILMSISNFLVKFWWLSLLLIIAAAWGLRVFLKTDFGKMKLDLLIFSLPAVGKLRKAMILAEFSRTLGLLIEGGVLVVDALSVVKEAVASAACRKAIDEAGEEVEKGAALAVALAKAEIIPPLLPQMISVGEETGKLSEVLLKISSYYEQEAETAIRNLTTAVEPVIMIILGVGIAFLIISVIMPIYNLTSQF
jgi:type II secretory pathway component PulF